MSPDSDENVRSRLYSAQRQFDLATILVATAAYAVIFALLQFIRAPISFASLAAVFIAITAFAQAFFFQGKRPRLASALAGATFFVVVIAVTRSLDASPTPRGHDITQYFPIVLVGMFWGYVTGTLIGSAFMAADVLRKQLFQRER
ncbi:MAG: hypothetical protein ACF8AM_12575 [Rhodopirellula sp. JB055]|uniref:hypothetical protein n=1 Tax=Rhodopirellula sp. JB055 TaxID=3342846 RepID=UPI00370C7B6E